MKTLKHTISLLIPLLFFAAFVYPQQSDDIIEEIKSSIVNMDASKLSSYFYTTINLEIGETDGNFSKKQAEVILQDFFRKSPVKTFTVNHQGSSNDGSKYMIGVYTSTKHSVFRVYVMMKPLDGKMQINKLQFEED